MRSDISPQNIIKSGLCIGCGSCVAQTDHPGASMQWDRHKQLKPEGSQTWMHEGPSNFSHTCPFSPLSANEDVIAAEMFPDAAHEDEHLGKFEAAFVGHVSERDFRARGSSGGMVSWVACELLRKGLVDGIVHVAAVENPQGQDAYFKYVVSRSPEEVQQGAKSRYYPIELSEVLKTIKEVPGRYAVVGIPCFIKAVQLLRRQDPMFRERIQFTLGLFCGHLKSEAFVDSFAWQMNVASPDIKQVEYRLKDSTRPANWYKARLTLHNGQTADKDWWHLADGDWGAGFFMNEACNYCDDVIAETADISFGDAWLEPYTSDGNGTNVVVVRSPTLHKMLKDGIDTGLLALKVESASFVHQTQEAGFRQRREGLAYRLTWPKKGIMPIKRVLPNHKGITLERKLIYRMRYSISKRSHQLSRLAHTFKMPQLYVTWARMALKIYQGCTYRRGMLGKIFGLFYKPKG